MRALLPAAIREPVFGTLASLYPKADWAPAHYSEAKPLFKIWPALPSKLTFALFRLCRPELKDQILHQDLLQPSQRL